MNWDDLDNRFKFHTAISSEQNAKYDSIRALVKVTAEAYNEICPDSREKSLAITHLEEAMFWANAAVARHS